jgi:hypothetical protein
MVFLLYVWQADVMLIVGVGERRQIAGKKCGA